MSYRNKYFNYNVILFYIFGIYAIINPKQLINSEPNNNYSANDLIRGWGIYCLTIGMILEKKFSINNILRFNFIISILWHLHIVKRIGWTKHHNNSIIINFIAFLLTYFDKY